MPITSTFLYSHKIYILDSLYKYNIYIFVLVLFRVICFARQQMKLYAYEKELFVPRTPMSTCTKYRSDEKSCTTVRLECE